MRAIVRSQPIPSANTTRTGARGQPPTAPSAQPAPSLGEAVLQLQRLVGNIAVQRLLQRAEVGASASNQRGAPVQRLLSGEAWFASQVQGRGIEPIHEQMLDRLRTHHARLGQARKEMEAGYAKDAQGFSPWSVYFQHATDLTTNLEELSKLCDRYLASRDTRGRLVRAVISRPFTTGSAREREVGREAAVYRLKSELPAADGDLKELVKEFRLRQRADREAKLSPEQKKLAGRYTDRQEREVTAGAGRGATKELSKLTYVFGGEESPFTGFFAEDQPVPAAATATKANIRDHGANRSVAMKRLDMLLGTNVIPRTHFAIHEGYFGFIMEQAEGEQASKMIRPRPLMEDPSVRQGMANLQVVDALSGQRDRHKQNYFIRPQKGDQPARVTGIDNDIAFGRGSHAEDPTRSAMYGYFGGLPSYVDKGVADRARALEEDDFELALGELLDKAEVGATVKRWRILCKRLDEMEEQGLLVKDLAEWGKLSTQQLAEPRSYLAGLAVPGQLNPFKDEAGNRFTYEELQQVRMLGPEEWEKQQAKQRDEARTPEEPELEELRA